MSNPRRLIALGPPYDDGTVPLSTAERDLDRMARAVLNRNEAGTHERNLALEVLGVLRGESERALTRKADR